jgi:hypothetical protein
MALRRYVKDVLRICSGSNRQIVATYDLRWTQHLLSGEADRQDDRACLYFAATPCQNNGLCKSINRVVSHELDIVFP